MNRTIMLGGREIPYTLERKNVKNVNLRIRSDGSVYVSASKKVAENKIEGFLSRKSHFILSAIDKYADIAKYSSIKHSYLTGESFQYLGRDLRLVVAQGKKNITSDGVYLYTSVPDPDDTVSKSSLIKKWYDNECKEVFDEIISEIYPIFQKYGVIKPGLRLREMSSRWGSCQYKRGVMTLNKKLIETSRECIEYVVMHEFVHFLHQNHSKKFYEMLGALMPDWKERKKQLEKYAFVGAE